MTRRRERGIMRRRPLTVLLSGFVVLSGACGGAVGSAAGSGGTGATRAPRPTFALTTEEQNRLNEASSPTSRPTIVKPEVLAYAAERTGAQATGRMELVIQVGEQPGKAPITINSTGTFNSAKNQFAMKMTMPGYAAAVDIVSDGKALYMRMPPGTFKLPAGKEWVKVPVNATAADSVNAEKVGGPAAYLEFLRSSGGEVSVVGTDVMDGVPTTHYRTQLALSDAFGSASKEQRADMEAQFKGLGTDLTKLSELRYDVDVWVGDDGLARQLKMAFDMSTIGLPGRMVIDMKLHDIGLPVTIELPNNSLVVDGKSLGLS